MPYCTNYNYVLLYGRGIRSELRAKSTTNVSKQFGENCVSQSHKPLLALVRVNRCTYISSHALHVESIVHCSQFRVNLINATQY